MQKKYKATGALLLSAVGFAATYPQTATFAGGLLNSGCLAAMVGGLADWFAVTALFRKPLGISYKTEILIRNRARIMQAILEFTGKDLLNAENIMKIVRSYDTAQMLLRYLQDFGGSEKIKRLVHSFAAVILAEVDSGRVGHELSKPLQQLPSPGLGSLGIEVLTAALQSVHFSRVAEEILSLAGDFLHQAPVQKTLKDMVSGIRQAYESGSAGRKMMLQMLDLSDERLTELVTEELDKYLQALQQEGHPDRLQMIAFLGKKIAQLKESEGYFKLMEGWEGRLLSGEKNITAAVKVFLTAVATGSAEETNGVAVDHFFARLDADLDMQRSLDQGFKRLLENFLQGQQPAILMIIEEKLARFSDEKLVQFVEERIADDLQMIRINGSLVGAFVGMILYVVTFMAERMWS